LRRIRKASHPIRFDDPNRIAIPFSLRVATDSLSRRNGQAWPLDPQERQGNRMNAKRFKNEVSEEHGFSRAASCLPNEVGALDPEG